MSVEYAGKGRKKRGVCVCDKCGARSQSYECRTAAPELDVCEAAEEKEGFVFEVGFFAMLTGNPRALCAKCKAPTAPTHNSAREEHA